MYRNGIDVEQDDFKSYVWFLIFNEFKRNFLSLQQEFIIKEIQEPETKLTEKQKTNGQKEAEIITKKPLKNISNFELD